MSRDVSSTTLDAGDTVDHATRLRFENAWHEGHPLPIEAALPEDGPARLTTLEELVYIELEQSWRVGRRVTTEDYVRRFPELGADDDRVRRLLQHELRVRYRFGDRPGVATYRQRFPALFPTESAVAALERLVSVSEGSVIGDRLGRYRLEAELGRGGFGLVWLARDESLARTVALKQMHAHIAEREDTRRRFFGEARVAARLEHPGVVPIYELGDSATGPFFAMKLVHGETLGDAILSFHELKKKDPPAQVALARARLVEACLAVARTMAYTHARRVIHRDLKPQNVILGAYGETMILDWGIAKSLDDIEAPAEVDDDGDWTSTRAGQVIGTPAYMAPEQARGEVHALDQRSDVFALGAMLYETLTGELPFPRVNSEDMLAAVASLRPVEKPPRALDPSVPRALEAICLKALAKDPRDRYADAGELAADLERHRAGAPVSAHRETLVERTTRWAKNHRTLVVTAGIALLLLFVGATVAALMIDEERAQARDAEQLARSAEVAARTSEREARDAGKAAEVARRQADDARKQADLERESAEHHLYVASLALAQRAWSDSDLASADRQLAATPAARRGWEWQYVMGLVHGALHELADTPTYRLAVDPSGTLLARVSADGVVDVVTRDGAPRARIATHAPVDDVVLMNDRVLVRSAGGVHSYDLQTQAARDALVDEAGPALRIARDARGTTLARISQPRRVTLFDAQSGARQASVEVQAGRYVNPDTLLSEAAPVEDIGLTPDFARAITLDLGQTLRATDLGSGALVWERALPTLSAPELAVGALVVVSQDRRFGSRVTRYDSTSGANVEPPTDFDRPVTALVAADERDVFVAGTIDGALHVVEAGVEVNVLRAHRAPLRDLVLAGNELVSAASDGVRAWDPQRPQAEVDVRAYQIAFTHDAPSTWLDAVGEARDRWTGVPTRPEDGAAANDIADMVLVAGPHDELVVLVREGIASIIERASRTTLVSLPAQAVAARADMVVFATPGLLRPWSTAERRFEPDVPVDASGQLTLLASSRGVLALVRDRVGLSALDAHGQTLWLMPMERRAGAAALSTDGSQLAVVEDGAVALRDPSSGELVTRLAIDHAVPTALAFLPDGSRLVVASDQRLDLWDVARAREVMRLPLEDRATAIAVSADGRSIGVALEDGRVCIFNASWPRD